MSNNTVKMYWQEVPSESDQIKSILPTGVYCEPANIVNSTHVNVEAKPWLQKTNLKKENTKAVSQQSKQTNSKGKISSKNNEANVRISSGNKVDNIINSYPPAHACSLAELRKEDKQRVADLVREMAKFSEEKEMAVSELNTLKSTFTEKLKMVEDEKQKMIKERDVLKEKLLRYELVLAEIKESRKDTNRGVDTILNNHVSLQDMSDAFRGFEKATDVDQLTSPDEFPGNSKKAKHNAVVDNNSEDEVKSQEGKKHLAGDHFEDADKVTDLFFKQQDKFHQQQEILQTQIEQLQKLQEGILFQQEQHLKGVLLETKKESHQLQSNQISYRNQEQQHSLHEPLFDEPSKHKHSQKLQNYISKQTNADNNGIISTEVGDGNNLKQANNLSPILVEDTMMEEKNKDNTLISVHCLNATTISSTDTAVQTEDNICMQEERPFTKRKDVGLQSDHASKAKADICVGTDNICEVMDVDDGKYGMKTLDLCKSHVNKLGEVLKNISSGKLAHEANMDSQKAVPKVNKNKKFSSESSAHKEKPLIDNSILDDDSDEEDHAVNENNSLSSALQQQHFRPASMLELIDGIQPPSASTSISSSFKKTSFVNERSHRTPLSPTNRQGKAKVKNERATKLHKVYGAIKHKHGTFKQDNAKEKSMEDIEEQKMIADVFFVR